MTQKVSEFIDRLQLELSTIVYDVKDVVGHDRKVMIVVRHPDNPKAGIVIGDDTIDGALSQLQKAKTDDILDGNNPT